MLFVIIAATLTAALLSSRHAYASDQLLRIRVMVQVGNDVVARPFMVVKNGERASVSIAGAKGLANPRDVSLVLSPKLGRNGIVSTDASLVITPLDQDGKPILAAKREETGTLMIALGQRGSYDWKDARDPKNGETIRLQLSIDPATAAQVEALQGGAK